MHHEITCINIYIITAKCMWKYDRDHVKCNVKCFIAEPFVFHWLNARVLPFDGNRGGKNVSWILRANKACVTAVLLENTSSLRCCSWEKWAPASSRFSTDLHGARWNIHKCMWTYNSYTDHKMTSEQHNMWIPALSCAQISLKTTQSSTWEDVYVMDSRLLNTFNTLPVACGVNMPLHFSSFINTA